MPNYDENITIDEKDASPSYTKVPKPYSEDPNGLLTEDSETILNEDGTQLLMEVG